MKHLNTVILKHQMFECQYSHQKMRYWLSHDLHKEKVGTEPFPSYCYSLSPPPYKHNFGSSMHFNLF